MGKFKVGDKVRILDVKGIAGARNEGYTDNEVVKLVNPNILNFVGFPGKITAEPLLISLDEYKYLELVDSKPTKKQRIESLEKRVEELEKLVSDYFKLPVEPSTDFLEDKPVKTPNQLRAEIIEKAKWFVESYLTSAKHGCGVVDIDATPKTKECGPMKYKFVVNEEKRTVVALGELYWVGGFDDEHKGIAKCNPSDVFNKWIGMAIALGRALWLDVSEFEGAVQPTEVVVGMSIESQTKNGEKFRYPSITSVADGKIYGIDSIRGYECFVYVDSKTRWGEWAAYKIINDTNAIYKSEVE